MNEKSANYQSDIHDVKYETEYLMTKLDCTTLINTTGRKRESLNGMWNFAADWYDSARRAHWYKEERFNDKDMEQPVDWDFEAWDRIQVPSVWNMQKPELFYFEGSGLYFRTFKYIKCYAQEKVFLCFEGASYQTTLFLNGEFIGTHDGASTPFSVEITQKLKMENRLIVVSDARRKSERIPMENTDWFNYGGVYRDLYLVRTPKFFIKDWFVYLVPDGTFSKIHVDVTCPQEIKCVKIIIPALNIEQEVKSNEAVIEFDSKELVLWSPENPFLYDVYIKCAQDEIHDRIGFREIRTQGNDILLNGKKVFLKGVCVHEDHYRLGKATKPSIIRQTIRHLKEMNGNYLRLAHYPHSRDFARIADEEGVLLWEEIPVYWAIAFNNSESFSDAENQLSELILRDRNRASVIIWSVGNENDDTDERLSFMSRLALRAKKMDSSRLVSAACLVNHVSLKIEDRLSEFLDVFGINEYYGWYDPDFDKLPAILRNSNPEKPVLICEFGGGARGGQRGTVDDFFTEDKQKALYEKQVAVFKQCPYIAGITPWILYDFRCPRRTNRYQEGFNRKGLIAEDRETKKLAFYVMQDFYAKID